MAIQTEVIINGVVMPSPVGGDANKAVKLNTGETAYEMVEDSDFADPVEEATTSRTIGASDEETRIELSNATTTTVTLPLEATTSLAVGFQFEIANLTSTATHVIAPESTVNINGANSNFTMAAWSHYLVKKTATDDWVVLG